jgi:hypothetical protein
MLSVMFQTNILHLDGTQYPGTETGSFYMANPVTMILFVLDAVHSDVEMCSVIVIQAKWFYLT